MANTPKKDEPVLIELQPELASKMAELASEAKLDAGQVVGRALKGADPEALKRESDAGGRAVMLDNAPRTRDWANLARPFAWCVLALTAFVFVGPFFVIASVDGLEGAAKIDKLVGWGTHVLAPVVGLAGAVIAYYFGVAKNDSDGS
jgi:hypothetical protein